jgi:hypothetical protein
MRSCTARWLPRHQALGEWARYVEWPLLGTQSNCWSRPLWLDHEVYQHIEKNPLTDRLKLTRNIAPVRCPDEAFLARVVTSIDEIKHLSETRNTVAHNPVLLSSKRLQDGKWDMKRVIGRNKPKVLSLVDVESAAERAQSASLELSGIVGASVMYAMRSANGLNDPRLKGAAKLLGAEIVGVSAT